MKILFMVLCVILILIGLLITLVNPVIGIIAIVFGVFGFIYYRKKPIKKEESQTAERPVTILEPMITHENETAAFNGEIEALPRVDVEKGTSSCKWRNPDTMPGVHITNITRKTNMGKLFPLVVIDTETTGIGAAKHRIVELSAIKLGPEFVPESCFTTLINPRKAIPPSASAVHHITDEMVKDAPTFPEVAASFAEYISGCNIVGHNIKFDLEFLYAAGLDLPNKAKVYDTMDLAKKVLTSPYRRMKYDKNEGGMVEMDEYDVENYKLTSLCDYYGIYRNDAHRSLSDCLATAKVLKELVEAKTGE